MSKNNNKRKVGRVSSKTPKTKFNLGGKRTVKAPVSQSQVVGSNAQRSTRIKRREFLGNVSVTGEGYKGRGLNFKVTSKSNGILTAVAQIAGNLGLTSSFPWISDVASAFEQFVVHNMKFDYVPACPTSTKGSVVIAPNYNSGDTSVPQSKTDLLDRVDTVRSPAWGQCSCKLDPKRLQSTTKEHFIRKSAVPKGQDVKTYDPFKLDVMFEADAVDAEQGLGELWADYDVTLHTPKAQRSDVSGYYFGLTGSHDEGFLPEFYGQDGGYPEFSVQPYGRTPGGFSILLESSESSCNYYITAISVPQTATSGTFLPSVVEPDNATNLYALGAGGGNDRLLTFMWSLGSISTPGYDGHVCALTLPTYTSGTATVKIYLMVTKLTSSAEYTFFTSIFSNKDGNEKEDREQPRYSKQVLPHGTNISPLLRGDMSVRRPSG